MMNATACAMTRARAGAAMLLCSYSSVEPVRNERYAGTSGRTQGETKETSPARNAIPAPTCVVTSASFDRTALESLVHLSEYRSDRHSYVAHQHPLVRHILF